MSSTTLSISEYFEKIIQLFSQAGIPTPRLDAEVLLAYVTNTNRAWLVAHSDKKIKNDEAAALEVVVQRRRKREPIAYLIGKKEFYGREFSVTPDVLIPRPETEDLIDLALASLHALQKISPAKSAANLNIIDVGTGSGCVGITLKLEQPELSVTLSDISPAALDIARQNAEKHNAKVEFVHSDLLSSYAKIQNPKSKIYFDLITANLPYVDYAWQRSPETDHEPALALFAAHGGLELINKLIEQSTKVLTPNGYLLLEADPEQHASIIGFAENLGFAHAITQDYAVALRLM